MPLKDNEKSNQMRSLPKHELERTEKAYEWTYEERIARD